MVVGGAGLRRLFLGFLLAAAEPEALLRLVRLVRRGGRLRRWLWLPRDLGRLYPLWGVGSSKIYGFISCRWGQGRRNWLFGHRLRGRSGRHGRRRRRARRGGRSRR